MKAGHSFELLAVSPLGAPCLCNPAADKLLAYQYRKPYDFPV